MQRLGGLLLILAGVSLGAYTFLPAPFDSERTLRDVTRISAAPDRLSQSGRSSWIAGDELETGSLPEQAAPSGAKPKAVISAAVAGMAPSDRPAVTWSAIVTADQSQQARITSSKPADSETRVQLTRDLQSELKRVGCYAGEVNGAWTTSTKKAMSTFMDRVNATLPVTEPDYILLTLVQGHAAKACGSTCPAGQTASDDGRCIPQAVIAARAAKKAKQEVAARDPQPAPARANVADASAVRETAPARIVAPAAGDKRNEERVAAAASKEVLPWQQDDDAIAPARATARPIQRPEGMMAVGASQIARAEIEDPPTTPVTESAAPRKAVRIVPEMQTERAAPKFDSTGAAYQRGLPGTKSGATVYRPKQASKPAAGAKRPKPSQAVRRPAPPVAHQPKSKFYYYAGSGRRGLARPGSPAFNMLQAMGGVY